LVVDNGRAVGECLRRDLFPQEKPMLRLMLVAAFVLALPMTASAQFTLFCQPVPVTVSSYYYPVYVYRVPVYVPAAPVCPQPTVSVQPLRTMPRAEDSVSRPPLGQPVESATLFPKRPQVEAESSHEASKFIPTEEASGRVARSYVPASGEPYFDERRVRLDPALRTSRYSVLFVNLTEGGLRLEVNGEVHRLGAGQRVLLEQDREVTWRVEGRPAETTRLSSRDEGVVITIRR
jgi:hypothetical protein